MALAARSSAFAPIVRAGLTSATLMTVSDLACQHMQQRLAGKAAPLDLNRASRFTLIGLAMHGPFFYLGFRAIDQRFGPAATLGQALTKAMVGQVTLFPTYMAGFFMAMGLLEGRGWEGATQLLKDRFPTAMVSGSVFWPIANITNFRYVPPTHRILYVNVCAMVWTTWLSYIASKEVQDKAPQTGSLFTDAASGAVVSSGAAGIIPRR